MLALAAALFAASTAAFPHEPDAEEIALGSLVDAELAFAKSSATQGVREAFLANFAPDGIALQPSPTRIATAWREAEPGRAPNATQLDWKPAQAGVAASHDFGFTTGPYVLRPARDAAHARQGIYFSVWQRDAAGRWKVLIDTGVATPHGADFAGLGAAPRGDEHDARAGQLRSVDARRVANARARLLTDEARGFGAGRELTPNAYARLLHADARLYRNGVAPIVSRTAVARATAERMRRVSWHPDDARMARSGDMAATYGRYREIDRDGDAHDGYYAHLWLRDREGDWRLAYDIALPAR